MRDHSEWAAVPSCVNKLSVSALRLPQSPEAFLYDL
nr:MAG TPA: hypothetical protein [Caudoviricetes sp.]